MLFFSFSGRTHRSAVCPSEREPGGVVTGRSGNFATARREAAFLRVFRRFAGGNRPGLGCFSLRGAADWEPKMRRNADSGVGAALSDRFRLAARIEERMPPNACESPRKRAEFSPNPEATLECVAHGQNAMRRGPARGIGGRDRVLIAHHTMSSNTNGGNVCRRKRSFYRRSYYSTAAVCVANTSTPADETKGVEQATQQFYAGLNAMFTGDAGPMQEVWSHADDVTYMGPGRRNSVGLEQCARGLGRAGHAEARRTGRAEGFAHRGRR